MNRIFLFAIISLITSCVSNETADSKDVSQSEIYQTYRVNWADGAGSVRASFRFGGENGTTLRLQNPGDLTYNGKELTEGKFLLGGAFYSNEINEYPAKHVFRFADFDGKVYENNFEFERLEFKNAPKNVRKTEDLILPLSRKLQNGENLNFRAQSDTTMFNEMIIGTSHKDPVYYDDKEQHLVVKPSFFAGFTDVPALIWIEKTEMIQPLEQSTNLGGEFHFSYKSEEIEVKRFE